ncbi:MAG: hypothetical protein MUF63_13345 [Rhodobacteraceae bacterium]|nr:hypothetical protein [Paracoccaceae bacterium]
MGDPDTSPRGTGLAGWLRSTVTLSLPGWAVAAGAIVLGLVIIVALD